MKKLNLKKIKLSTKDEKQLMYFCDFMEYKYVITKNEDGFLKKGVIVDSNDNFVGYIQKEIGLLIYLDKEGLRHSIFTKEEIEKVSEISKRIFNDEKTYKPNIRWIPKLGWIQSTFKRIEDGNNRQSKVSRTSVESLFC